MTNITHGGARHRADCRPTTVLSSFGQSAGKAARRGVLAAASSGLAITMAATTATAMESVPSVPAQGASVSTQATGTTTHTVQAGDTVAELARQYGASISGIIEANGLNAQALIRVGEVLTIPGGGAGGSAATQVAAVSGTTTHTVQAGDTVAELARQYGGSISGIVEANGLNAQALIRVGEVLTIPGAGAGGSTATQAAVSVDRERAAASRSTVRSEAPPANASGSAILDIAYRYIGTPYVWGGSSPAGFDCSGFTSYVYAQAGISIPRSSSAQRSAGTQVAASAAQPGDLVWWPGHIGIYMGNGEYIAAQSPGNPLSVRDIYKPNPTFIRVA